MKVRFSLAVVALAGLLCAPLARAQDVRSGKPGLQPPIRSKTQSHFGSSPFTPPQATDTNFVVDQGGGLDTGCTYRSGGPLVFTIQLGRVVGDVAKLKQAGRLSAKAALRLPAFDVDFDAVVSGINPERDRVYFNGHPVVETFLTGADNTWKLNEFQIPIEWVNFASDPGVGGTAAAQGNQIRIDIDTANSSDNWCTSIDWAALSFEAVRPVILVHGIFSSGDVAWGGLWAPRLGADGIPYSKQLSMGSLDSIGNNAAKIRAEVEASKRRWGVEKVRLFCHSKGGLDARDYAELRDDVSQVVQIGTPNAGSRLATIAQGSSLVLFGLLGTAAINTLAGPAGVQLTPTYMSWYNGHHGHNANVLYTALAGDYKPDCTFGIFCSHPVDALLVGLTGEGDSIVPVSSVFALGYTKNRTFTTQGADNDAIHTKLTTAGRVYDMLLDRINDTTKATMAPAAAATSELVHTATVGGALGAGQSQTLHFPIETRGPALVTLLFPSGDLSFGLISPSGQRFDAASVVGRSDVARERRQIEGGWIEVYQLLNAEPGNWAAEITSLRVDDPSGKTGFALHAWFQGSNLTLDGTVVRDTVRLGEPLDLRVTLRRGALAVTGADVSARIALPNGSVVDLPLRDDGATGDATAGDGVYSGRLAATTQSGYHSMVFRANGTPTTSPASFSRESFTLAAVSQSATHLTGSLGAHGLDSNGNGLFDRLVVDVGVDAMAAGSYSLYGELLDTHGNRHEARAVATLAAGSGTLPLAFDGARVYANAVDGPYTLTTLRLAEESPAGVLPLEEQAPAFATPTFGFREFEHAPIALAGSGSATGVDTNGNGLFDRLDVVLDLDLDAADFYSWSARLIAPTGEEVGFASGSGSLGAGRQSIPLRYTGSTIGQSGLDGPYTVADLLVFGSSVALVSDRALTTGPFQARQFEGFVGDTTPPALQVTLTPGILFPPDHRMVAIQAAITVTDNKDANPTVKLLSIASSEADAGVGSGDLPNDIQGAVPGTDDRSFLLRAEKYLVTRSYRVTYEARDAAGNVATQTATVLVQKPK